MNLTQLRTLVALADTGSLSRAAQRLSLSQSAVSQALAGLEDRLGVRLAIRQHRGMALTAAGERIVAHARASLDELEAIRHLARQAQGIERGRLAVAGFPSVFATLMPALLRRFATAHPGVRVVVLEGTDDEVVAWLEAGAVDLGVVVDDHTSAACATTLHRDRWVAVLPAGHPLSRPDDRRLTLDELAAQSFVLATGGCSRHARSVMARHGVSLSDVRIEVRDWSSAFALIAEGLGVSLVPALHLPPPGEARRGLRIRELATPIERPLALAVAPASVDSPLVEAFLQVAAAR